MLRKMFVRDSYDVTAGRRKAKNGKPCIVEWSIHEG